MLRQPQTMVFALFLGLATIGWVGAKEDEEESPALYRAIFLFQDRSGAPLQFVSYLSEEGRATFPVHCGTGRDWIATVEFERGNKKGLTLNVEIGDRASVSEVAGPDGRIRRVSVQLLDVRIPYVMGRTASVLETPNYSVSVAVAPVNTRSRGN